MNEDPTGEKRLTWNVAVSWMTQLVTIVIGFLMPRLIDESLGQVQLGIWDFGWAIMSYLSLVNIGLGANANYYVATFNAEGDHKRLNEVLSSAHFVQVLVTILVVLVSVALYYSLPVWLSDTIAEHIEDTQLMVFFLGLSIATQMLFDAYRGLMTGVHRWDVHHGINTLHHTLSAVGMVGTLLSGYGLVAMAVVYFVSTLVAEIIRYFAARHFCPQANLRFRLANWVDTRRVAVFSIKNLVAMVGPLGVQQTVSLLITLRLGPTALAMFARPTALIRHLDIFVSKFAFVIMSTTSSLKGMGRSDELRSFAIEMSRIGWALAIPAGVFLMVAGPSLIELWMGEDYVVVDLMVLLAAAGCLTAASRPAYRILFGLDQHGTVAMPSLIIYLSSLAIGVAVLMMTEVTLLGAALVYVVGDVIFNAIVVPYQLSRVIGVSFFRYLWQVSYQALAIGAVSYAVLSYVVPAGLGNLALDIGFAALVHGTLVAVLYWFFLLTDAQKSRIWSLMPFARSA